MAARKKTAKKAVEEITVVETVVELSNVVETIETPEIEELVDTEIESTEEVVEEDTIDTKKEYYVVLGAPSFFIVEKDGTTVTIRRSNKYRRGDIVKL